MKNNETPFDLAVDPESLNERREVKLQLPLRTHVRLRGAKLLLRQSIGATVERALDAYFVSRPGHRLDAGVSAQALA